MEVSALQQMLSRFKQLQEDLQRQVNSVAVEASAGGGMVSVKMNGQKQVLEVHVEPEKALCDGPQSLYPEQFVELMDELRIIVPAVRRTVA